MKLRIKQTGEVVDAYSIDAQNVETIKVQYFTRNGVLDHFDFDSLEELNNCLEDYKPAEPLIKDEKIRKAVKAWAEVNGIKKIIVFDWGNNAPYTPVGAVDFAENGSHLEIRFRTEERFDTDRIYTIEELCGEEKTCEN